MGDVHMDVEELKSQVKTLARETVRIQDRVRRLEDELQELRSLVTPLDRGSLVRSEDE